MVGETPSSRTINQLPRSGSTESRPTKENSGRENATPWKNLALSQKTSNGGPAPLSKQTG